MTRGLTEEVASNHNWVAFAVKPPGLIIVFFVSQMLRTAAGRRTQNTLAEDKQLNPVVGNRRIVLHFCVSRRDYSGPQVATANRNVLSSWDQKLLYVCQGRKGQLGGTIPGSVTGAIAFRTLMLVGLDQPRSTNSYLQQREGAPHTGFDSRRRSTVKPTEGEAPLKSTLETTLERLALTEIEIESKP